MSQFSEKSYTPPGAAPPQVPGQYNQYAQGPGQQGQPGQQQLYPQVGQQQLQQLTPPPQMQQPPQYAQPTPQANYIQPQDQTPQYQQSPPGQYTPSPPPGQGPLPPQVQQQQNQYQPYPQPVQYVQYPNVQQPIPAAQQYVYAQPQMTAYQPQQQSYAPAPGQQGPYVGPTIVVQQPMPVVGMSIANSGGNRNVNNLPRDATGRREWSFGLCNCFDDFGTCILGWCCPCMLYAQLKQRVDYLNAYGTPDPTRGGSGVDLNCLVWCALHAATGCGCVLQAINRGNIRHRYMIEGDGILDFCIAGWCSPCELTQEHREIDLEEQSLMK